MAKSPSRKPRKSKTVAQAIKVDVLPMSRLTDEDDEPSFDDCNAQIEALRKVELPILAEFIKKSAYEADRKRTDTYSMATMAILEAWRCGSMLNLAKEKVEHGQFLKWLEKLFSNHDVSVRTAQRYMQLAKSCPDARNLTKSVPSLRQAYIACGILPEPPEADETGTKDAVAHARLGLIKSVTSVQIRLRRFSEEKIRLDKHTKQELITAKKEIDQWFKKLIG